MILTNDMANAEAVGAAQKKRSASSDARKTARANVPSAESTISQASHILSQTSTHDHRSGLDEMMKRPDQSIFLVDILAWDRERAP